MSVLAPSESAPQSLFDLVVDVEHRGNTPAGELRHPVYKGCHSA